MVGLALRRPLSRLLLWRPYATDSFRPARQPNFSLSVLRRGNEPERPRKTSTSRWHSTSSAFLGYGLFKSGVIGSASLLVCPRTCAVAPKLRRSASRVRAGRAGSWAWCPSSGDRSAAIAPATSLSVANRQPSGGRAAGLGLRRQRLNRNSTFYTSCTPTR